jgi:GNAT superfamily N-acetyltransferase
LTAPFLIEALSAAHDEAAFDCGIEPLNRYIAQQAAQDVRRNISKCFVAIDAQTGAMAGFYTLAAASAALADLPGDIARKLPRYPTVPVVRMGRLAVHQAHKGRKLGAALVFDAIERCIRSEVGAFALLVDAKDDGAAEFYRHHGFVAFDAAPRTLFLPFKTAGLT